jgi:hypothetical protein
VIAAAFAVAARLLVLVVPAHIARAVAGATLSILMRDMLESEIRRILRLVDETPDDLLPRNLKRGILGMIPVDFHQLDEAKCPEHPNRKRASRPFAFDVWTLKISAAGP